MDLTGALAPYFSCVRYSTAKKYATVLILACLVAPFKKPLDIFYWSLDDWHDLNRPQFSSLAAATAASAATATKVKPFKVQVASLYF